MLRQWESTLLGQLATIVPSRIDSVVAGKLGTSGGVLFRTVESPVPPSGYTSGHDEQRASKIDLQKVFARCKAIGTIARIAQACNMNSDARCHGINTKPSSGGHAAPAQFTRETEHTCQAPDIILALRRKARKRAMSWLGFSATLITHHFRQYAPLRGPPAKRYRASAQNVTRHLMTGLATALDMHGMQLTCGTKDGSQFGVTKPCFNASAGKLAEKLEREARDLSGTARMRIHCPRRRS
jgi:hypothetical protein